MDKIIKPKEINKSFGLNYDQTFKDMQSPTNYKVGAVEKIVLRPDGQWLEFSPECEIQKTDYDDLMDCVSESAINILKILLGAKFPSSFLTIDLSQRFTAKMSGTTRQGNSPYKVANSVRHDGFVKEIDWPRDRSMTWAKYYSSIPTSVVAKGKMSVLQFDINYEYVPVNKSALKEALKYGPVQVIGYAWASDENGVYHDWGYRPNHAFTLVGYKPNGNWLVYDSYPTDFIIDENSDKQEFVKELDKNFKFGDAMLYSIKLKTTNQQSWLWKIINMLKNFYRDIKSGKFYFVKTVNGKTMKQEITSINGVLTVLDVNFGAKQAEWGELGQYTNTTFFGN